MTLTEWIRKVKEKEYLVIGELIKESVTKNKQRHGIYCLGLIDFSPNTMSHLEKFQEGMPVRFRRMWYTPTGVFKREEAIVGKSVFSFCAAQKAIQFDDWGPNNQKLQVNYGFLTLHPIVDGSILLLDDDYK